MKLFKYLLTIPTLSLLLLFPQGVLAATLSLNPAQGTLNKGCVVSVNIDLDTTGTQTDGTDAILIYDPAIFDVNEQSITNGTIYPEYPGNAVDSANKKISISGLASVQTPFTGKGTLATVRFKVKDAVTQGSTQINFDFSPSDKTKTTDSNVVERGTVADVLSSVTNGTYTIGSGTSCVVAAGAPAAGTPVSGGTPTVGSPGSAGTGVTADQEPVYKTLPDAGLEGPTLILAGIGVFLTIVGIAGLALL